MTNSTNYSRNSAFFLLIAGLTLVDIVLDYRSGVSIKHLMIEFIVLFVSLLAFNFYLDRLKVNQSKVKNQIDGANENAKKSMNFYYIMWDANLSTFCAQFQQK